MQNIDTSIIVDELYPLIKEKISKNKDKFKRNIGNFITERHTELNEVAPYSRIFFNKKDVDNVFKSLDLNEKDVIEILKNTFYWDINYSPSCSKEPYVPVLMCCIKYFIEVKDYTMALLTTIFTCFTGKFYASLHSSFWRTYLPKKEVMDYVVNNMLSDKFYLKTEGTIFKSVKKICETYLDKYSSDFMDKNLTDDDFCKKLIQQLRDRLKSFMKNIANLYFEAVESKAYMNYETDSLDPDDFRITDTDAGKAARLMEAAVSIMTSERIDMKTVDNCHDSRVSSKNIISILESIFGDNSNIPDLKWVVNVLICDFMSNYPGRDVGGADFIAYTSKPKPNTKNEYLLKVKEIVLKWLNSNAVFRKCKSNITISSYYRSIIMYFALTISRVANK